MIDFLILYEHKARELENDCLIKAELEKRGYKVDLINAYEYKKIKYFLYYKPKVILVPFLYDNKDISNIIHSRVGNIRKIVNLQWEQVLSKKWEDIGFHIPKEDSIYATHISWGKANLLRLKKAGVNNAVLTGPIQMDFLRDNFKTYYKTKDQIINEYKFDKNKRIVLYISSFTLTNMTKNEIKGIEDRVYSSVNDLKNIMTISKQDTLNWIIKLLNEKKDITFVYRPHPNEKADQSLISLQKKYNNFKVIDNYSVKQWILVSDKIFTWISTSIVEVFFANKNCSILRPVNINENLDAEININAKLTNSYEQMIEFLDNDSKSFPIKYNIIQNYYSFDELPSYIRISNLLEKVLKMKKYDIKNNLHKIHYFEVIKNVIMDEIIIKFDLVNKSSNINNMELKNRINSIRSEYRKFDKEMVAQKEIKRIVSKIREIID